MLSKAGVKEGNTVGRKVVVAKKTLGTIYEVAPFLVSFGIAHAL